MTKRTIRRATILVFCLLIFSSLPAMDFTKQQAKVLRCVGKIENFLPEGHRIYGSGTLLRDRYVLSCYHLIHKGVGQMIIRFEGENKAIMRDLEVVSFDAVNDLGLYRITKPMPQGWGHVDVAKRLTAGDRLMYAGFNASALARLRFDIAEEYEKFGTMLHPIYFGDSGGGVFKSNGRLVGVIHILIIDTRFGYQVNTYIGYAVALNKIKDFLAPRMMLPVPKKYREPEEAWKMNREVEAEKERRIKK